MAPIPHLPVSMHTMNNNTLKLTAAALAAASATWSFTAGQFWPGVLAVLAASAATFAAIRKEDTE